MVGLVRSSVIASLLGLAACGSSSSGIAGIDNFTVLAQSEGFASSETEISGTGTVLFANSTGTAAAHSNYGVSFKLADGGYLKLILQAKDDLSEGVELLFSRTGAALGGVLSAEGEESVLTTKLTSINASGIVTLYIDLDNSPASLARVVIWNAKSTDASTALVDTNASGHPVSPGKGTGQRWGLELSGATVSYAALQAAFLN